MAQLGVGDLVMRSHRLLKTRGTIVRAASRSPGEARQVWVKWDHANTLPNPSREAADDLVLVEPPDPPRSPSPLHDSAPPSGPHQSEDGLDGMATNMPFIGRG
jgi:hypothetical protein